MNTINELIGKKRIITHRGLEPSREGFFSESSLEAFRDHLRRGFGGIEFDPNPTKDGIIVMHDSNLSRPTDGRDTRDVGQVTAEEITNIPLARGHIPTFDQVMELIRESDSSVNAMHLKARFQTPEMLQRILEALSKHKDIFSKLFVFDVKVETARIIKKEFPTLRLAPSVAHPYDIERYGKAVGNTLLTLEEALALRADGVIDGVWGDEWDRKGESKYQISNVKYQMSNEVAHKTFYTEENFERLKEVGLFVALVTPELHGTSPGLYGGESHEDARDKKTLFRRIKEIKDAGADYFCTDYPEDVARL